MTGRNQEIDVSLLDTLAAVFLVTIQRGKFFATMRALQQ